ncbi:hypothetical protein AVEN_16791-1 [Araneus ventricosus]|uniref:Uncharacterized protein n=1 Tax=Araneus ventricosus TaxID=182803 RepID=A0A4Y2BS57_ARAVE|nr:hypothetical protein AVEN_16791-1 [Araneus ventricosus]
MQKKIDDLKSIFLEGLVVSIRLQGRRAPVLKLDSTQDLPCMRDCCKLHHAQWVKRPPAVVVRKFGQRVPSQMSSSSSDSGSILRGPTQNSPRVASKTRR